MRTYRTYSSPEQLVRKAMICTIVSTGDANIAAWRMPVTKWMLCDGQVNIDTYEVVLWSPTRNVEVNNLTASPAFSILRISTFCLNQNVCAVIRPAVTTDRFPSEIKHCIDFRLTLKMNTSPLTRNKLKKKYQLSNQPFVIFLFFCKFEFKFNSCVQKERGGGHSFCLITLSFQTVLKNKMKIFFLNFLAEALSKIFCKF